MLKPIDDYILISRAAPEQKSPGGIVLPDAAKEKPDRGEVMAVGPGRLLDDGTRAAMQVDVGDVVIFQKYGGHEVEDGGDEFLLVREGSILAITE